MSWLAGAIGAVGIGGVVTLAIFLARMATTNRADLLKLVDATQTIGVRDRDQAVRIERFKGLQDALDQKTDELARANAAVAAARKLLTAPAPGSVNDALQLLSDMSAAASAAPPARSDGEGAVHGAPTS